MLSARPKLKVPLSPLDYTLEYASVLALILCWAYLFITYSTLPEIIPIHFNLKGEADGFGSRVTVFILPAIMTVVVTGMTVLNRFPQLFNYMSKITELNALSEYRRATRMIRFVKFVIATFTLVLTVYIIRSSNDGVSRLPWWLIWSFIIALFIPVVVTLYQAARSPKRT